LCFSPFVRAGVICSVLCLVMFLSDLYNIQVTHCISMPDEFKFSTMQRQGQNTSLSEFSTSNPIVFGALLLSTWQVPVYTILGTSVAFVRAQAITPHETPSCLTCLTHLKFASNLLKNSMLDTFGKYKCECSGRLDTFGYG